MNRVVALCFLLLAAVLAYFRIDSQPVWAPFAVSNVASEEEQDLLPSHEVQHTQNAHKTNSATVIDSWLPDTGAPSVHAASLIALKDGAIRAFWFAGSREGAADVAIYTAVLDPKSHNWSAPTVVADRVGVEKGLLRYIAKLGNPVPARMSDGRLQLFFVTVSIGGWAGSSITSMISDDEGLTWSVPQRLITSPFLNLSTLVKTPAVPFADGRLGLPAYHEWIGRFGEFLRIDAARVIDKRRMSSGRSSIQPLVLVSNAQDATAFFRQTREAGLPKQIPVAQTVNAGQVWQQASDLPISNPNSAVAGIQLNNGVRLLALNNIETGRYRLVLMMSDSQLTNWQTIAVLEDDSALPDNERHEFSYPYLISVDGDDAHLVYTWDRKKIRHRYFSAAWLKNAHAQLPNAESDASSQEVKQ
jgi:predicted neuraminidase